MHPRTAELLEHLDRERAALRLAVEGVPPDRRERRPSPESWSVAEVLEHLALVERRLTQLFTTWMAEARAQGLGAESESTPLVPTLDWATVLDRRRKITASEAVRPRGDLNAPAAWGVLEEAQRALRTVVLEGDGLALGEVVRPHPVLGPLNLYQWVAFVGAHEARHAAQIREIGALLTEGARAASAPPAS